MALDLRCQKRRASSGFTMLEMVVAMVIGCLVMAVTYQLFSMLMNPDHGVPSMTSGSFLSQKAIDGIQALTQRLQQSIQIISPTPGKTSSILIFRDIINDQISMQVQSGGLIAVGPQGQENDPIPLPGTKFKPVNPIHVPGCVAASFTSLGPSCLVMTLSFKDESGKTASILNTVNFQNQNLAK